MKIQDAREWGDQLADLLSFQRYEEACDLLSPLLAERTPFRLLDANGGGLGIEPLDAVNVFLDQVAAQRTMGGWVIIISTQRQQLNRDLPGTFERSYKFVIAADVWGATDTFGERVPGPALVSHFEPSLNVLAPWQECPNCWIRRVISVSVHHRAKQSRGEVSLLPQARALLDLLNPLFEERCTDAIKGIGWGLKTMGRYYPELVADWLVQQAGRTHRALILRKATTYLPSDLRQRILAAALKLFSKLGYAGATIDAIAQEAGVAPLTVFAVFGNKHSILASLISVQSVETTSRSFSWSDPGHKRCSRRRILSAKFIDLLPIYRIFWNAWRLSLRSCAWQQRPNRISPKC